MCLEANTINSNIVIKFFLICFRKPISCMLITMKMYIIISPTVQWIEMIHKKFLFIPESPTRHQFQCHINSQLSCDLQCSPAQIQFVQYHWSAHWPPLCHKRTRYRAEVCGDGVTERFGIPHHRHQNVSTSHHQELECVPTSHSHR